MPALYAHKIFGAKVYKELPDNIREIISEFKEEFLIGLHGPDVLFFHMPWKDGRVSKIGNRLHKRPFALLERRAFKVLKYEKDDAALAYFIGNICHFVLDMSCHPLVDSAVSKTGMNHGKIEMELDRELMSADGHEPLKYPSHAHLPVNRRTAEIASEFYKGVSSKEFFDGMLCMKATYAALNTDSRKAKKVLCMIMDKAGLGNKVSSVAMSSDKSKIAEDYVKIIAEKLDASVEAAVNEICDFTASVLSGDEKTTKLSKKNFMGK